MNKLIEKLITCFGARRTILIIAFGALVFDVLSVAMVMFGLLVMVAFFQIEHKAVFIMVGFLCGELWEQLEANRKNLVSKLTEVWQSETA